MNKKQLSKCVRDGVLETRDLTPMEDKAMVVGVTVSALSFGTGVAGLATGSIAVMNTAVIGAWVGASVCVGVVAKSFIRGFREQWKIEMKMNKSCYSK